METQDPHSRAEGVVLLHGIARSAASMRRLAGSLDAAGFATLNLDYRSRKATLEQLSDQIHSQIAAFAEQCPGAVHVVTHSMGGLLARVYMAVHRPARLGRVVMIAPPNGGSEIADALGTLALYRWYFGPAGQQLTTAHAASQARRVGTIDYPVGIVAGRRSIDPVSSTLWLSGPNDGKVTVERTKLDGMTDHVVIPVAHPFIMAHPLAIRHTIAFLRRGRFSG